MYIEYLVQAFKCRLFLPPAYKCASRSMHGSPEACSCAAQNAGFFRGDVEIALPHGGGTGG